MTRILFLYNNSRQIVTGGQKYEDMLYRTLCSQPGLEIDRLWLGRGKGRVAKLIAPLRNLSLLRRLRRYDIVFFNSVETLAFIPLARVLTRLMGKRVGVIHHHFLYEEQSGWRRRYYLWLEGAFLRSASHIVVPSPFILDQCRAMFPGRPIVYWQIPFELPARVALSPEAGNLLYIGTIERRKGLEFLIEAMALLKLRGVACRLKLIGKTVDAAYRAALEERIAATGIDVDFMGYVSQDVKDEAIAKADIFAFPSRHEGYGMAICEALGFGLPVVCFDNSAMPYTVKDGRNGLLVPDGDAEAYADALQRVITDRPLRTRLSAGAAESARQLMTPARFTATVTRDIKAMVK